MDPYLNDHIATITLSTKDNWIDFFGGELKNLPYFHSMMIILSEICGKSPREFISFPLLGPVFVLLLFMVSNTILKHPFLSGFTTVIAYLGFAGPYYSIWPHGFGFLLFLPCLFSLFRFSKQKNLSYLIVAFTLLTAIHFYSYTAELWVLSFLGVFCVFTLTTGRFEWNKNPFMFLFTISLIFFLYFNKLIYDRFLLINIDGVFVSASIFITKYVKFLDYQDFSIGGEYIYQSISPLSLSLLNVIYISLLILPIIVLIASLMHIIIGKKRGIRDVLNSDLLFMIALVIGGVPHILIYATFGAVLLGYILFIFPLLSVFFLDAANYSLNIRYVYVTLLTVLIIIIVCWNWNVGHSSGGQIIDSYEGYNEFRFSAKYVLSDICREQISITDHFTGGIISVFAAQNQQIFRRDENYVFYNNEIFESLGKGKLELKNHNLIINKKHSNKKTWAGGWRDFKPLYGYLSIFESNNANNKIYNDDLILVYN